MTFTAGGFDRDIATKVTGTGLFSDKVFMVYDPKILKTLVEKMEPPVCGVIYEGILSDGAVGDTGASTYLSVSLIIIADKRIRDIRQAIDKLTIADLLDATRNAIRKTLSPATTLWEFVLEIPFELSDRDLGYYQKWKTKVSV